MKLSLLARTVRWLLIAILFIGIGGCCLFAVAQSKWAKEQIALHLTQTLKEAGIDAQFTHINGRVPFTWTLEKAELYLPHQQQLILENITLRLAILPLFRGKLEIDYIHVRSGLCVITAPSSVNPTAISLPQVKHMLKERLEQFQLPCALRLTHVAVDQFDYKEGDCQLSLGATGKAVISQNKEQFSILLNLFSPQTQNSYVELSIEGSRRMNQISLGLQMHLDQLPPSFTLRAELFSSLHLSGPWTTWHALLYDLPVRSIPLEGALGGSCLDTHLGYTPLFDTDWRFNTLFSVPSCEELVIKHLSLQSKPLTIRAKGSLLQDVLKSKLAVTFSLNDLGYYPQLKSLGTLQGKAHYHNENIQLSFDTNNLHIEQVLVGHLAGRLQGSLNFSGLDAECTLLAKEGAIPFESTFRTTLSPEKVALSSLLIKTEADTLSGQVAYDWKTHLYQGDLQLSIAQINQFESLFPSRRLYGQLQVQVTLSHSEEIQQVLASASGQQMRYENVLIDNLYCRAQVTPFSPDAKGTFWIRGEKVYSEGLYIEQCTIDLQSFPNAANLFSARLEGRLDAPFTCALAGEWNTKQEAWEVTVRQLEGELLALPFQLRHPVTLGLTPSSLTLSPVDFTLGEGKLHASMLLSQEQVRCALQATHFPLNAISCLRPRFGLHGSVSGSAHLEGSLQHIEGSLNAVLEEAKIIHFGKSKPVRSKGSIQMHLNDNLLQVHTDLKASDGQFIDFTASLPTSYNLYPFSLALDTTSPTSAELVAEGKLEDLFDFINLGTNHFTGFISSRLFLSQTLASPSVLGNIHWQGGRYDNYFTGIALKEIEADFQADNQTIRLTQFQARDDRSGSVTATGTLKLKPSAHFPYHVDAEMDNLHALGFDMIDCHLSGPIYLNGTTRGMLAQGNLLIDEAKIQVTERLPYDGVSLPFTYVHKPLHLDSLTAPKGPRFAFQLDLELTATRNVMVSGRGLNAELEGDIRLHGTNTNISASGSLHLVKGEYTFSGKTFKLTEASVVFNDKPSRSAYMNVSGILSLSDVSITAMMRGPLTSPQLTFHSNPHKSTSAILALILFNKEISEINHMEAVQLAGTLLSLSEGAGPNVLESIRKTIGVDRLNISSNPGSDEIAVQVGKYLTRGIMITLSQSATSSQVIVEVELPKGFVFQAETQEEEEGKFSLKWRKSY